MASATNPAGTRTTNKSSEPESDSASGQTNQLPLMKSVLILGKGNLAKRVILVLRTRGNGESARHQDSQHANTHIDTHVHKRKNDFTYSALWPAHTTAAVAVSFAHPQSNSSLFPASSYTSFFILFQVLPASKRKLLPPDRGKRIGTRFACVCVCVKCGLFEKFPSVPYRSARRRHINTCRSSVAVS